VPASKPASVPLPQPPIVDEPDEPAPESQPVLALDDDALFVTEGWTDSVPPVPRPPSVFPSGDPGSREDLLTKLVDPVNADQAARDLRSHPEWLKGSPPPMLVAALSNVDYDADNPVFELARAWEREPMCHALVAALRGEAEPSVREHLAWLLKHFAVPGSWKAIADIAGSNDEPAMIRRWLLEALDRLAAGRAIGWRELGDLATSVATSSTDAALRDGVVGILVSLERSDEKRKLLLEILRADNDEVVLASAVNALASVLPMELDPAIVDRLLGHPSERVQRSVRNLIESARQKE
jgi:hypothetical protein